MQFIQNNLFEIIYAVLVAGIAYLSIRVGLRKLRDLEADRLESAESMEVSEAVETESPDEDSDNIIRRRAVSSIESRFQTIRNFYVPLVLSLAAVFILIPFLSTISASYLSVFAGAFAVLVGIAARPLIENLISGMVITFSQPIRINDTVIIDDKYGTVERINLLYTVVKIWNWRRYNIPNHVFLQKEFENLSQTDEHEWAYIPFHVSPEANLERVKEIAKQAIRCKYLLEIEPPSFWVMKLNESSVECWVAGWAANPAETWALKSSTRKRLMELLQKEGIPTHVQHNQLKVPPITMQGTQNRPSAP
tara:strand:- start:14297 stop:15217 length:921 start_codon:yes stop_codon:yes gene_type:complete